MDNEFLDQDITPGEVLDALINAQQWDERPVLFEFETADFKIEALVIRKGGSYGTS